VCKLKPSFSFLTYDVEILLRFQDIGYFLLCLMEEKNLLPKICTNLMEHFDGLFLFDNVHHNLAY